MSQNTNTAIARSKEQVELLSDDKAELIAEMANGLDLTRPSAQSELRKRLAANSEISDVELTAWLVEFGGSRLVDVVPSIRLSTRVEPTGEVSSEQKRANLRIGRVYIQSQA